MANLRFAVTEILVKKKICYDIINYIIDVEHRSKINEYYSKNPKIINFNKKTPYKEFKKILKKVK